MHLQSLLRVHASKSTDFADVYSQCIKAHSDYARRRALTRKRAVRTYGKRILHSLRALTLIDGGKIDYCSIF
jgi:hypothetical protein